MSALPKSVSHVCFVEEKTNCGKSSCRVCGGKGGRFEHGPYWYAYFTRADGSTGKVYVGRDRDTWAGLYRVDLKTGDIAGKAKAAPAPAPEPKTTPKTVTPRKKAGAIPSAWARIFTRAGANPKLACEILGVTPGTKLAEADVKRAYRAGMVANHPDTGGNEEKAKAIIAAFKFLEPFLT